MYYSDFNDDLVDNGVPIIPICLCLDTSWSMRGAPIAELNRGLKLFYDAVRQDEIACAAADIAIVTFGKDGAQCQFDFAQLYNRPEPPELVSGGRTPMGDAVNLALDLLEKRRELYRSNGMEHYKPWLILMTDGCPYGDSSTKSVPNAQKRISELIANRKISVFTIWIGNDNTVSGMKTLAGFSPNRPPKKLRGLDFNSFFRWLSKSVSAASQSTSEEAIQLPPTDWATP